MCDTTSLHLGGIFFDKPWNIFVMSHPWFVLRSTMAYWLWTWVWPRKLLRVASCECLKAKKTWRMHFIIFCATNAPNVWCSWTIITIFSKMLKWVGIAYLRNIWWKLTSQSILNIWQTCVEMAEVLYINIHHSTMIIKLQTGKKNHWVEIKI
jgi:hypothetical protein